MESVGIAVCPSGALRQGIKVVALSVGDAVLAIVVLFSPHRTRAASCVVCMMPYGAAAATLHPC